MATKKRQAKNTIAGQVDTMRLVTTKLVPHTKLDDDELIYFNRIVKCRETASWNDLHLDFAANLAIAMVQHDEANLDIAQRGLMVRNERGTMVMNPAIAAKSSISATILQLSKALGLTASQNGLASPDQAKRNQADAQARDSIEKIAKDGLLA